MYQHLNFQPELIWRVISVLLSKSVYGIINGAPNFVADLSQLVTKRKWTFILLPVIVPSSPGVTGVVPVPRCGGKKHQLKPSIPAVTPLMLFKQRRLTVTPVSHAVGGNSNILVFVLLCLFPFFPEPLVVLDKLHQLLYPLTHVYTLVLPILIYRVVPDISGKYKATMYRKTTKSNSKYTT